ncbi:MAG: lasso peptide biosynthesis B2 protein [Chloroflexi bacterium]|nr:lasso peptide biosynthesis B2 protein [Chloroflexota bacterium]MBI3732514.1 lasso peptide biosynthesis B2 protein [Chloroflexota bacterium]
MRHKLRTARSFSWQDWQWLGQAWLWLLAVDLCLRLMPLRRAQRLLASGSARSPEAQDVPATIRRWQAFVKIAARYHLYPTRCLQQALALQTLLSRCGIQSALQIGVRKEGSALSAHAWLEWNGLPVGEPADIVERFAPLRMGEAAA